MIHKPIGKSKSICKVISDITESVKLVEEIFSYGVLSVFVNVY